MLKLPEVTGNNAQGINMDYIDANIISHTFENGIGIITFDLDITEIKDGIWGNHGSRYSAFADCRFTSIIIPNSITKIGNFTFLNCINLRSINIPNSLTTIGSSAFEYCNDMQSIIIPSSITNIGSRAFYMCRVSRDNYINNTEYTDEQLGMIIFDVETQDGLLIKGDKLTSARNWITSIVIPDYVTYIDGLSFKSSLISITFPNRELTCIYVNAFDGTPWYDNQPNGPIYVNNILYRYKGETPESVVIKEGITIITSGAFSGKTLSSLTLPSTISKILGIGSSTDYLSDVIILASTPPILESGFTRNPGIPLYPNIYVPSESVDTYKSDSNWSTYSNKIKGFDLEHYNQTGDIIISE